MLAVILSTLVPIPCHVLMAFGSAARTSRLIWLTLVAATVADAIGPRKFQFRRPNLNWSEGRALRAFWEAMQGAWKAFTYNVPNPGGTTTATLVTFDQAPLSLEYLRNAVQAGLTFVEVVDPAQVPSYTVASTCVRFPSNALSTALLSEVQQIVPLIHIAPRQPAWSATATYAVNDWVSYKGVTYISKVAANTGHQPDTSPTQWRVGDIYLSDRRVTVGGQLYLPRLIGIGEHGSDVIISQDIKGSSDNVRFTFGNADRVMTQLANDTDLKYAEIDLCLFHVNSGILLQLWKGVIQNFVSDGTASFPVTCSDGFFQIMNQYPERVVSRQCWKIFNDGVNCPYAAHGSGGDPDSCDYYLESANGCQAHGMAKYFGGQQADPQGVNILDNSTGFVGLGRNRVTATSIISDSGVIGAPVTAVNAPNQIVSSWLAEPRRAVVPLSAEEVAQFWASFRTFRDLALAGLMLLDGLRSCEVLGMQLEDLHLADAQISVLGKGSKRRVLPLASELVEVLQNYLRLERPLTNSPYLFVSLKGPRRGRPMTRAGLRRLFRYHRLTSQTPRANPHRLRHTFGTDMVRAGISLPALQHRTGVTTGYNTVPDELDELQNIAADAACVAIPALLIEPDVE
jgi:hypothetical protein